MTNTIQGTPNADDFVDLFAEGIKSYRAAKADGKIDSGDLLVLLPLIPKITAAIEGAGNAIPELLDMNSDEGKAFATKVAGLAGEAGEKVAEIVTGVVEIALGGLKVAKALKS